MIRRMDWVVEISLSYLQSSYQFCTTSAGIRQVSSHLSHCFNPRKEIWLGQLLLREWLQANYRTCTNLHMLFYVFSHKLKDRLALITRAELIDEPQRCQMTALPFPHTPVAPVGLRSEKRMLDLLHVAVHWLKKRVTLKLEKWISPVNALPWTLHLPGSIRAPQPPKQKYPWQISICSLGKSMCYTSSFWDAEPYFPAHRHAVIWDVGNQATGKCKVYIRAWAYRPKKVLDLSKKGVH